MCTRKSMAFILLLVFTVGCFSVSTQATQCLGQEFQIYSKEFPDAFIEISAPNLRSPKDTASIETVNATVYYEENIEKIEDKLVVRNSRLLSKSEVYEIGKDNFTAIAPTAAAGTYRGKLTLSFNVSPTTNSNEYLLTGNATWSGSTSGLDGSDYPASGNDFVGFVWGGGFDYKNASCAGTDNWGYSNTSLRQVTTSTVNPNAGYVWTFYEGNKTSGVVDYMQKINSTITLRKNTLTGSGNTTSFVYQYIHTYQTASGSISINVGGSGASGSFSLSSVSKQWSLCCSVSNIKY